MLTNKTYLDDLQEKKKQQKRRTMHLNHNAHEKAVINKEHHKVKARQHYHN